MSRSRQPEDESSETASRAGNVEDNEIGRTVQDPQTDISSEELEGLRLAFVVAESRRRRRALLGGLFLLGLLGVFFWLMMEHGDSGFRPDVEQGEQDVLAETNDPVCRGVIGEVTSIGEDYYAQESDIERGLGSKDREEVLRVQGLLEDQREKLGKASRKSNGAIFRYPKSRGELEQWFAFVDTEYSHLIRLADERSVRLASALEGEPSAAVKQADATSLDLQGRALLAIHESFHSFRVWHSSSLHPCGRAASEIIPEG